LDNFDDVKEYCDSYRRKLETIKEKKHQTFGSKRIRIVAISDLHVPFVREDLLTRIIRKHSGAEYCVVNGDLFDNYLISTFPKSKEIPFAIEYASVFSIVRELAKNFGHVVLVDGNHDGGRFAREMGKINPTIQFLVKKSPLEYIAAGMNFSERGDDLGILKMDNVVYAGQEMDESGGWWTQIGKVVFAHRMKGFRKAPMANATFVADWFIERDVDFQCLVSAHSHRQGQVEYKGRIIIDQGAICLPMEYEASGGCSLPPPVLGYAIVDIDTKGNVDPETTRYINLGTYSGQ